MRRIGVAFPGADPSSPATWSGTPAGVISGLRTNGMEPVPLTVGASPTVRAVVANVVALGYLRASRDVRTSVRQARGAARATPAMSWVDSLGTTAGIGEADALDGIIQIGTGVTLRTSIPIVTYEDMTVMQNLRDPYEQYALLSRRAMASRIRRQHDAYRQVVACCLATEWAAASVRDDYSVPAEKVHVVGVGFHPLPAAPDRVWTTPRYLFVGIDWERKNGGAVLRAFSQIHKEIPEARLDVVGQHPPITQDGVTGHGVLRRDIPEERREVERLFTEATCFVMPSRLEAAGIVYLEAASAGVPVIGTRAGGAGWLIGDGGVVIDPTSHDQLVNAMRSYSDPDVAARTGAKGRQRSNLFTWPAVARRLTDALHGEPPKEPTSAE